MKVTTLLLVSAIILLVKPDAVRLLHVNLSHFYEHAGKCFESSHTKHNYYVDDVSHLAEGNNGCQEKFFCKVHDIFRKRQLCKDNKKQQLVERNLEAYFRKKTINCTKTLKTVTSTGVQIRLSTFLRHVKRCVELRNFTDGRKSLNTTQTQQMFDVST